MELNVHTLIKTTFAFDSSILMCPQVLPRELYNEVIDDVINYIKPKLPPNGRYNYWVTCLEDLKSRETFQEKYEDWEDGLKRGVFNLNKVDLWRNDIGKMENILSKNNKVLEWWKKINVKLI